MQVITAPYNAVESWLYDRFVGPALTTLHREIEQELFSRISTLRTVLDVGCGGGHYVLSAAATHPDVAWTGIDLSKDQIARAQRRASGRTNIKFVQGDALKLPFENGAFDAVVSMGSLKHWHDRAAGLRECVRVLRPGGVLVVAEADRDSSDEAQARFVALFPIPGFLRPKVLQKFRETAVLQSLSMAEARALLESLDIAEPSVKPIGNLPLLRMAGRVT